MDAEFVKRFAEDWIEAWNAHDLDRVMAHYAEDVEFYSPFVRKVLGEVSGRVRGNEALRAYFAKALDAYPELHFDLYTVFSGVNSVTLHYRSVNALIAAEVMLFNEDGAVSTVYSHYSEAKQ